MSKTWNVFSVSAKYTKTSLAVLLSALFESNFDWAVGMTMVGRKNGLTPFFPWGLHIHLTYRCIFEKIPSFFSKRDTHSSL